MTTQNAANIAAEVATQVITQAAHGFAQNNVVYLNGANYALALANTAASAVAVGIVTKVIDVNNFILQSSGIVINQAGLNPGDIYYLSTTVAGALTNVFNPVGGTFQTPFYIAQTATTALMINQPGRVTQSNSVLATNILHNSTYVIQTYGDNWDSVTAPANNNNTRLVDRWFYLASAADTADVSLQAATGNSFGQANEVVFDQETANEQWGWGQIVETLGAPTFKNTPLTFVISAYRDAANAAPNILRFAICEWVGAVNTATRNMINTWNGGGVDPVLAANWAYITASGQINLSDNLSYYSITGTSSNICNNAAVLIWLDDLNTAIGDFVYIGSSWLIAGENIAVPADGTQVQTASGLFPVKSEAQEELDCQRFVYSTYNNSLRPGTVSQVGRLSSQLASTGGTEVYNLNTRLPTMRATPAVAWYNPTTGNINNLGNLAAAGADYPITGPSVNPGRENSGYPTVTVDPGVALPLIAHIVADTGNNF